VKVNAFLDEFDAHAALGEALHQAAQVVEVARQTIHAVHHHRVAFAHEGEQPFQFGPLGVLARRLVGEHLVHRNLLQLPFRVLVEAADADVADALTVQGILLREMCQEEIYDP
jgi:hypothetical protein